MSFAQRQTLRAASPDIVEKRVTGQRSALRRGSPDPRRQQRCYRHAITLSPIYIKSRREEGKRRQRGRGGRETPKGSRRDTSGTLVSALSDKSLIMFGPSRRLGPMFLPWRGET